MIKPRLSPPKEEAALVFESSFGEWLAIESSRHTVDFELVKNKSASYKATEIFIVIAA